MGHIFGVWPGVLEGGKRCPRPFTRVSQAPVAGQTPKIDQFRAQDMFFLLFLEITRGSEGWQNGGIETARGRDWVEVGFTWTRAN